jgi:hypothetical protein
MYARHIYTPARSSADTFVPVSAEPVSAGGRRELCVAALNYFGCAIELEGRPLIRPAEWGPSSAPPERVCN